MKYIIDNKWMDTDKSELILREEFGRYERSLYVTPKQNYFIQELDCIKGGSIGLSCTREEAIELTKKYRPYRVKLFFPEILSELEEG